MVLSLLLFIHGFLASVVVELSLFGVGKSLVGLGHLNEVVLRPVLLLLVIVWVVLLDQLSVGLFDLVIGGVSGHAQDLIEVSSVLLLLQFYHAHHQESET